MVSVFHASIAKEFDGTVKVWGEGIAANGSNITSVTTLNSSFGTGSNQLSGTILKFAAASNTINHQFAVLTTNGLYVWGKSANVLVPAVTNVAANSFRKVSIGTLTNATIDGTTSTAVKADGLPYGVNPGDVKMMFLFGLVLDPLLGTITIFLGSLLALPMSIYLYISEKETSNLSRVVIF